MNSSQRMVAEVPIDNRSSEVHWLALEEDVSSHGWFLFFHRSLTEASEFDSWHMTRAAAMEEAERLWGVRQQDWYQKADRPSSRPDMP